MTRTVTGSLFDHVAMVLKFDLDPDEIFLLEATTGSGVSITRWSFINDDIGPINKFYQKCIFRHIEFERSQDVLNSFNIFLE